VAVWLGAEEQSLALAQCPTTHRDVRLSEGRRVVTRADADIKRRDAGRR
jgi:hypothetical protein